jgi:hypothetical protein
MTVEEKSVSELIEFQRTEAPASEGRAVHIPQALFMRLSAMGFSVGVHPEALP